MNLLFVTPLYRPFTSGATAFVAAMAHRLVADGHQVSVLTTDAATAEHLWRPPARGSRLPGRATLAGVAVPRLAVRYPWPAPHAFGVLRRAGHWLARSPLPPAVQRPVLMRLARWMPPLTGLAQTLPRLVAAADVVHAVESSWDGLFTAAATAAATRGKPFVAMPLMHLGDAHVRAHFQMAHQLDAYRRADTILALSHQEQAEYVRLGVVPARVRRMAMGIEPLRPADDPAAVAAFRRQFDVQGPLVAFLGANTYDKGAFTLALAAAQLAAAGTPITIVYAGPGSADLTSFLARQSPDIRAQLHERVRILGVVDEATKHQLLAACALLALPSQVDTFGIVLLEAWAHGKPVIGANVGGIPDLVRAGQDGLLAPFGDAPALADAIRQLAFAPDLATRLGQAGRERVLQDFTWDRTYQTLRGIYDAAMHRNQT